MVPGLREEELGARTAGSEGEGSGPRSPRFQCIFTVSLVSSDGDSDLQSSMARSAVLCPKVC